MLNPILFTTSWTMIKQYSMTEVRACSITFSSRLVGSLPESCSLPTYAGPSMKWLCTIPPTVSCTWHCP